MLPNTGSSPLLLLKKLHAPRGAPGRPRARRCPAPAKVRTRRSSPVRAMDATTHTIQQRAIRLGLGSALSPSLPAHSLTAALQHSSVEVERGTTIARCTARGTYGRRAELRSCLKVRSPRNAPCFCKALTYEGLQT